MKRVWIILVVLAGVAAVAVFGNGNRAGSSVPLPEDPMAGARLFRDKGCAQCHGLGEDNGKIGPNLSRIHLRGSLLDVAGAMWNHAPTMQQQMEERRVAPPQLTSQEMANLVAFLSAYQFYLSQLGKPGDPVKGMQVFKDKHCTTCHALKPGDEGGKPGPNLHGYTRLSPIQIAQAMWNHGPAMADHFSAMSLSQPQFTGVEMADLIAYLQRAAAPVDGEPAYVEPGSPNNGRALFNDKGCVRCHAIRGVGGSSDAPDLGKRREEFVRSVTEVAGLMWNHGGAMWQKMQQLKLPAVEFKGNEMADIIAYLYFINYFDKPGEPDLGRELFRKKGCVHCHAMDKDSIKIGPNLADSPAVGSPIDTISAMWNHARQMEPAMRAKGIPWPKFEPGEMADLVEYIRIQREKKQAAP